MIQLSRGTYGLFCRHSIVLALAMTVLSSSTHAQADPLQTSTDEGPAPHLERPWEGFDEARLTLSAGLIQPLLLRGGNIELDFFYRRFVMSYSHGFALKLEGSTVVGDAKEQGLAFYLPYSTGISIGYRLLEWLDVRLEGKVHRFEARDGASGEELIRYTTYTLGLGVYAQYRPFYHFGVRVAGWLEGFVMTTSVRYWPTLATTLPNDEHVYNSGAGQSVRHRAANIGIANTPFIFNVSLGYMLAF